MTFFFSHVIYKMNLLTRLAFRPYLKIISKRFPSLRAIGTQMPWFFCLDGAVSFYSYWTNASFAFSTNCPKASMSETASSANIFLLISIPDLRSPLMKVL